MPESPSPAEQDARHAQLVALGLANAEPDERLVGLLDLVARLLRVPHVALLFASGQKQWTKASVGMSASTSEPFEIVGEALAARQLRVSSSEEPRDEGGCGGLRFQAALPVGTDDAPCLGVLWIADSRARTLTPQDEDALRGFGVQVDALLELRGTERGLWVTETETRAPDQTLTDMQTLSTAVIARAPQELHGMEEELFQFLTALPIAVLVLRADGRPLFANERAYDLVGVSADQTGIEALWTLLTPFLPGSDHPLPATRRPLVRASAGEAVPPTELTFRRYGELIPVLVSAEPVFGSNGRVRFGIAAYQEMSRVHMLERQLRQAQKMEAVGRLAGGVAHDFNNLLTAIFSFGQFAIDSLHKTDPVRGDVEEIIKAAEKAEELTQQLLAFSRKQTVQPRIVRLNTIIESLARMLDRLVGEDVEMVYGLADDSGNVLVDAGALDQVIVNLVVNAKDAMPAGGKIVIETRSVVIDSTFEQSHEAEMPPGRYEVLAVSDTGAGMDPETQAQIFEPFFSTKGPTKGTGLGLATCYGIVKQADGFIWAYSERGVGTTFKIYLPQSSEALDDLEDTDEDSLTQLMGSETILLVEDDAQVRHLATRSLIKHGYAVLEAANGGEGILICEDHPGEIDLLLTDVVMPRMSGRRLAERVIQVRPGLPVLFMSGYTDDAIAEHGILEPGIDLLQKPFAPRELLVRVRRALRERPTLPPPSE